MSDALFEALGIDESDCIDATEVAEINRVLKLIRVEAAKIAKVNDTEDTLGLLKALYLGVKAFTKEATPELARKMNNAHNNGEPVSLSTIDPETAKKAAEADMLRKQLEDLQATATTPAATTKALGGSPTDSIMAEIEQYVAQDPARAKGVFDLLQSLSALSEDDYKARAVLMRRIVDASPDWELIRSPRGEMLPSILVAAIQKVADLEKLLNPLDSGSVAHQLAVVEKALADEQDASRADSLAGKLQTAEAKLAAAEKDLDPAITGSVGSKAQWFDYHDADADGWKAKLAAAIQALNDERDTAKATSLAGKLKQANDDLTKVKKERDDAVKVRTPMENAFNGADRLLDRALENLADDKFFTKKLVPGHVKTAREKIDEARQTLRDAQNTAKATP